jgi:C4-dicarboxylate-specific signal transduction histidine kinase
VAVLDTSTTGERDWRGLRFDPHAASRESLRILTQRMGADTAFLMLRQDDQSIAFSELGSNWSTGALLARDPLIASASSRALEHGRAVHDVAWEGGATARLSSYGLFAAVRLEGFKGTFGVVVFAYRARPADCEARLDELQRNPGTEVLALEYASLAARYEALERRVEKAEERRRALTNILSDLNKFNRRLTDQGKAMIHILADYEKDRARAGRQTERLDGSRRALLNILKDSHTSNLRLADSRKAMIHIMGDLRETTREIQKREQELRDKQEQLVQAGKLATLGELTTGVAHELNNPLNNIGLYVGNVIDLIELGRMDKARILTELNKTMFQIRKATEIISHLRTFGRAAPVSREPVIINQVVERALALLQEQLRLREIKVEINLSADNPIVMGNPIQIEQVVLNLLTNARDAVAKSAVRRIMLTCSVQQKWVELTIEDTGPGIPKGLEQRVFDPFFTTKEVGAGTGLGLSITYGIIREHGGSIQVTSPPGQSACFRILLPLTERTG